jgi:hypothetical protein
MRSPRAAGQAGRKARVIPADHAGSLLCRLLICHPEVVGIEILGQTEMLEGTISYSLGVLLPGGRELYIDVEDAPAHGRIDARDAPARPLGAGS